MTSIERIEDLRRHYPAPSGRAVEKELSELDVHCRNFIELSPFFVIASAGADGTLDASPRGGEPGFVKIANERTLLIPDATGNNRLDNLTNIVETGRVGMLFLVPGVDETLRVNGRAAISEDGDLRVQVATERFTPKVVVVVTVESAYLHCAKALMRSKLWDPATQIERSALPSMGQMIKDQTGSISLPESQEAMIARYQKDL
jgi:hypothetical protein